MAVDKKRDDVPVRWYVITAAFLFFCSGEETAEREAVKTGTCFAVIGSVPECSKNLKSVGSLYKANRDLEREGHFFRLGLFETSFLLG